MRLRFYSSWFLAAALASGCAASFGVRTEEGRGLTQMKHVEPAKVLVSCQKELEPGSKVLGPVVAAGDGSSGEEALKKLREAAADLGANAVIDLRLEFAQGFWAPAVKASGIAIRRGDR